ncbi:hypothetical protein [Thiohalobacter thiocyanaticus]|uniref:hypothetical protein n=1 Tax=Thiohalobacter thiocyanaticus TaxID=585455 RepID=UPI001F4E5C53|nr:hypothetical protein [Thiohalobacter thiocyanaticus]
MADAHCPLARAENCSGKRSRSSTIFSITVRRQQEVPCSSNIDLQGMTPILHTSGMYGSDHGNTRMVVPVAAHPVNKNSIIVFDLSQDPALLLDHSAKTLAERLYTASEDLPEGVERPALKQLLVNKCPVIAPTSTLTGEAARRLNIDFMACRQNRQRLLDARKEIQKKLGKIFEPREFEPVTDPDLMIYAGGFFDDKDKALMERVHQVPPDQLNGQGWNFNDGRLPEMLFRYRARNYPETLDPEEQARWLQHCRARLLEGESGHLSFTGFREELEQLRTQAGDDVSRLSLLNEVEAFGHELGRFVQGSA